MTSRIPTAAVNACLDRQHYIENCCSSPSATVPLPGNSALHARTRVFRLFLSHPTRPLRRALRMSCVPTAPLAELARRCKLANGQKGSNAKLCIAEEERSKRSMQRSKTAKLRAKLCCTFRCSRVIAAQVKALEAVHAEGCIQYQGCCGPSLLPNLLTSRHLHFYDLFRTP